MMTLNARNFFMLVTEMRNAQKMYFRNRTKEELEKSKELEKEIEHKIQELTYSSNYTKKYFREIAKHFFELGLKAQKGE